MNVTIREMEKRRSIRKYKAELPAKEDLDLIVEAGLYAASGMGRQSPIILVVTQKEMRDKLAEANRRILGAPEGVDPFYGAPAVLVVLANKADPTGIYDGSLVMGNMMLAAHSLKLGSCWIHRAKEEFETDEYKQLLQDLGVEGEYEGIGHCIIGYADEEPEASPRKECRDFYIS